MSLKALSMASSGESADKLLVLLHGWGANAQDVAGLAPYLKLSGYQLLFPDAPFVHPQAAGGRMWYSLPADYGFGATDDFEQQAELQQSRQELLNWLNSLAATTGIPLTKTILAGFSQGGAMTLDVGLQLPLAGMMILSGYSHAPLTVPVSDRPVLLIHGRQDPVVPIDRAHLVRSQLTAQGLTVEYHEFAMGHEISLEALEISGRFCQAQV